MSETIDRTFGERGWDSIPGLLDREGIAKTTAAIEAALPRLAREVDAWLGSPRTYAEHQERQHEYISRDLPTALRHYLRGELDLATRLSAPIKEALCAPSFHERLASALGAPRIFVHYPPMLRFVRPNALASAVPPHQDWTYNAHMTEFVTVWIPLVRITPECGGVMLFEGSHKHGRRDHVAKGAWDYGATGDVSAYRQHHFEGDAGDALLFPPQELHASVPNRSSLTRMSLDVRVFFDEGVTEKSFLDPRTGDVTRRGA